MNKISQWNIPWAPVCTALLFLVMGWCSAYFLHFHSQHRLLAPDDYHVSVYSAADFAHRTDSAERYKKHFMNGVGDIYVEVSLKGTASAMPVLNRVVRLPMLFLLFILVIPVWKAVRARPDEATVEAGRDGFAEQTSGGG